MPELRDLSVADLGAAHEINSANVPAVGDVSLDRLTELHEMAAISSGVFDEDGSMLGFCVVFPPGTSYGSVNYAWFMSRYGDAYYLDRVAFAAAVRRRGLGSRLYDAVESRIRTERPDIARLALEVNVDPPNPGSMAFHLGRGYVEVGRQTTDYGAEVAMLQKPLR